MTLSSFIACVKITFQALEKELKARCVKMTVSHDGSVLILTQNFELLVMDNHEIRKTVSFGSSPPVGAIINAVMDPIDSIFSIRVQGSSKMRIFQLLMVLWQKNFLFKRPWWF